MNELVGGLLERALPATRKRYAHRIANAKGTDFQNDAPRSFQNDRPDGAQRSA